MGNKSALSERDDDETTGPACGQVCEPSYGSGCPKASLCSMPRKVGAGAVELRSHEHGAREQ